MPTVNSLPDYITVSYPIALERVCRNCKFWRKHKALEVGICREIDHENPIASTFDGHLKTAPTFGCSLFEAAEND